MFEHAIAERLVVDVAGDALDDAVTGDRHRAFDRVEQGGVGVGVVERLARGVDQRHAALRQEEADGPFAAVECLGNEAADRHVLVRRRAHQGDLRVVHVQPSVSELRRHGGERTEVDHVDGADRADVRDAAAGDRPEPVGSGGEHTAHEVVGDLGRGHVEDRGDQAGVDQLLHRLPSRAGRVEDERLEPRFDRARETARRAVS